MATNPIKVHDKALAHLSRGLYRSPASAVRELVSNAWDAGAEHVVITTGVPSFTMLTIRDDGEGMELVQFKTLMTGGIGNSSKRSGGDWLTQTAAGHSVHRPVLGRFGIGLLGIAQVCSSFIFASRTKSGAVFAARVRIEDFVRDRMDSVNNVESGEPAEARLSIGEWEELSTGSDNTVEGFELPAAHGTLVIVTDPHPAFVRSFRDTLRPPVSASKERKEASHRVPIDLAIPALAPPNYDEIREALPPSRWSEVIERMQETAFLDSRGDYWRFLWDLAVTCPLPYIAPDAIPDELVTTDHKRIGAYRFKVEVDGRELRKPLRLHDDAEYLSVPIPAYETSSFGRALRFHGYLVAQDGLQLKPDELQGILVRIKDVSVGPYDAGMLEYRVNQGPRSRWLTGEIFVEAGLEDAVNVDRDSFNTFHPHYKELQRVIHVYLARMFSLTYVGIQKRSKASAHKRSNKRKKHLGAIVERATGLSAVFSTSASELPNIELLSDRVSVAIPNADALDTKRANSELAAAILVLFAVAQSAKPAEREKRFRQYLLDLLREW